MINARKISITFFISTIVRSFVVQQKLFPSSCIFLILFLFLTDTVTSLYDTISKARIPQVLKTPEKVGFYLISGENTGAGLLSAHEAIRLRDGRLQTSNRYSLFFCFVIC
jgi:hypothetical protein